MPAIQNTRYKLLKFRLNQGWFVRSMVRLHLSHVFHFNYKKCYRWLVCVYGLENESQVAKATFLFSLNNRLKQAT